VYIFTCIVDRQISNLPRIFLFTRRLLYTYGVDTSIYLLSMFLSMCQLSVNERHGAVKPYTEWNANEYLRYAHLPVKPHNDYYTISDITVNGQAINGDVISIMAVVKQVSGDILS